MYKDFLGAGFAANDVAPADSEVFHRGDTINFEVRYTMTYGGGQEQWIEEYAVDSRDYAPGMHTFKAEGKEHRAEGE